MNNFSATVLLLLMLYTSCIPESPRANALFSTAFRQNHQRLAKKIAL